MSDNYFIVTKSRLTRHAAVGAQCDREAPRLMPDVSRMNERMDNTNNAPITHPTPPRSDVASIDEMKAVSEHNRDLGAKRRADMKHRNDFIGNWRILETELWEPADLDLVGPAKIVLESNNNGGMALIAIEAEIDYRVVLRDGSPAIEFSFDGFDEDQRVTGRGWAVRDGDYLRGRLFFHQGDASAFVAKRNARRRK